MACSSVAIEVWQIFRNAGSQNLLRRYEELDVLVLTSSSSSKRLALQEYLQIISSRDAGSGELSQSIAGQWRKS
jgi:hypothetical protein